MAFKKAIYIYTQFFLTWRKREIGTKNDIFWQKVENLKKYLKCVKSKLVASQFDVVELNARTFRYIEDDLRPLEARKIKFCMKKVHFPKI